MHAMGGSTELGSLGSAGASMPRQLGVAGCAYSGGRVHLHGWQDARTYAGTATLQEGCRGTEEHRQCRSVSRCVWCSRPCSANSTTARMYQPSSSSAGLVWGC